MPSSRHTASATLCRLLLLVALVATTPHAASAQAVINEFMAANTSTLEDADGDFSDWIEIRNISSGRLQMDDWYLTDEIAVPDKWQFPVIALDPGEYLVVFASGKDIADPDEPHTNFKLSSNGEYLALTTNAGQNVIHAFDPQYPDQQADVSYGLYQGELRYFTTPTPGQSNVLTSLPIATMRVAASDGNFSGKVQVDWDAVHGALFYQVYRAATLYETFLPVSTWRQDTTFNDSTATPGRLYFYRLRAATDGAGAQASALSQVNSGWRLLSAALPIASQGATGHVALAWNPVEGASHYRVSRASNPLASPVAVSPWQTELTFEDDNVTPGKTYQYWVQTATNADGFQASKMGPGTTAWAAAVDSPEVPTFLMSLKNCAIEGNLFSGFQLFSSSAKAQVKIKRLPKGLPEGVLLVDGISAMQGGSFYVRATAIPSIRINGDIAKFYSDLSIRELATSGTILSITTKNSHITDLSIAGLLGRLKMTASNNSTDETDPIMAGLSLRVGGVSREVVSVIALNGLILWNMEYNQIGVKSLLLATKKYRTTEKETYLSLSGGAVGTIQAPEIGRITIKGGGAQMDGIDSQDSHAPMKVSTKAGLFSVGPKGLERPLVISGDLTLNRLESASTNLSVSTAGGNIAVEDIRVSGEIQQLAAKHVLVRLPDKPVEVLGGHVGTPFRTSNTLSLLLDEGLSNQTTYTLLAEIWNLIDDAGTDPLKAELAPATYAALTANNIETNDAAYLTNLIQTTLAQISLTTWQDVTSANTSALIVSGTSSTVDKRNIKSVFGSTGVSGYFVAVDGSIGRIGTSKPKANLFDPRIEGESWSLPSGSKGIKFKGDPTIGKDRVPEGFTVHYEMNGSPY